MLILYLEDRKDKIPAVRECVESLGYRLRTCHTVSAALRALEQQSFDLVISGVHLELENALDLVRSIKKHPNLSHLPIILIDSHQSPFAKTVNASLEIACQTLGVTHFLAMSEFDSKRLCELLKETVETARAGSQVPLLPVRPRKQLARAIAAVIEERSHDGQ